MDRTTPTRTSHRPLLLAPVLALAACGAPGYQRVISVNPPDASVYINGEKFGQGNSRPYRFVFGDVDRIFVQATHKDYIPQLEVFTEEKIKDMVETNTQVSMTLRSR